MEINKKQNISTTTTSTISIRVCGDEKVGKTSFINALANNKISTAHNKRCMESDFVVVKLNYEGTQIILKLWEGKDVPGYNALFVMYDVSCRESFEEAIKKLSFERKKHPKVPIMLIANKMDLQTERCVMEYEGEMNAIQYETLFNETSSKNHAFVRESLEEFIRSIV